MSLERSPGRGGALSICKEGRTNDSIALQQARKLFNDSFRRERRAHLAPIT
jgi:hypothetical protein